MLRILHITGGMNRGGLETLLMNLHRNINRDILQFDYMILYEEKQDYEDEIIELGGRIYRSPRFRVWKFNYLPYMRFIREFFLQHREYKIVHGHDIYYMWLPLSEAKKQGRITIAHSHNTCISDSIIKYPVLRLFAYPERFKADHFFACSKLAGTYRFGHNVNVDFLPNGIETAKYKFSSETRRLIRESRGISSENTLVLGHVGRFFPPKNHGFLIDVFRYLHENVPDSKLWLIGTGILEEKIRAQVHNYGLDNAVDFIGVTGDVHKYLAGMDVLAFPSLFEGLGIALIEAQCSGLPCIASDRIQDEAVITDRVQLMTIRHSDIERWGREIMKYHSQSYKEGREIYADKVYEAGFDIKNIARKLQDFYLSLI